MSIVLHLFVSVVLLAPALTHAASLDVPSNGDRLSGIGILHGWKCTAEGEITVAFNDGTPIPATYGSPRGDTSAACGNEGNNGFYTFWNWAILGDGEHTAVAYDDGVEFARSTFTVTTTGEEFLVGAHAQVLVEDFPSSGETTMLEWNQSTQHFEMVNIAVQMRSTIDRPDDISGAQIHAVYVLPSDGVDEHLDTDGTIATSLEGTQRWLFSQVSQRLRLDTFQGNLDITFFRLALTDAQMDAKGDFIRDQIELELSQAGRLAPNKIYAVYYGGKSTVTCGSGAWPPDLLGVVGAVYLNSPLCPDEVFSANLATIGYREFGMLHEIFHLLGAVPRGAPNHVLDGHVGDDPTDLMYAGPLGWYPQAIDVGRDDYYGHDHPNLLDLEDSPYLSR